MTQPGAIAAAFDLARIDRVVIGAAITADQAREARDPAAIVAVNVGAVAGRSGVPRRAVSRGLSI